MPRITPDQLRNCRDSSQPALLSEGDYYWRHPDGLPCSHQEHPGKAIDMMETGSNDVLAIKVNLKDMHLVS